MHLGITTPAVTLFPGACSPWEETAGIDDIARIAFTADRLGFNHITCSEHVAVPADIAAERGGTYWDPLATLGYLAARTDRIRLVTQVLVLGYHHPLEIAKRYGTLDVVSGGRLTLGLGVGSLKEEFDLLGVPFEDRGPRADDALAALRAALSRTQPEYHGTYYRFSDFVVQPHAAQPRVPLWVGGRTRRSLRRAIEHGDGWVPFGLSHPDLRSMLATADVPARFEIVLSVGAQLDPIADSDGAISALREVSRAGATIAGVGLSARDADHYCEQMVRLREIALDEGHDFPDKFESPPGQ
ncbi:TIGR03619 family F420-dependent LLM class oxidoreductase [Rhodococcus sp. P1Y]|uniref:TIGR03619 family F420-dependent LLM class oxidoreductase n=1 Tax=Rhodococcus sp. P1Y TaxID=1302308 RepID=UPI000EB5AD24|nr:TIGR03619 family F420-dependent LLM class oxidoreductase [Rhodococcus sp. P1Y]AYJ48326.1 TIGR03619 family F420-dependent LLM class oxidoreductase [Rhodococcus sp. P1Y]